MKRTTEEIIQLLIGKLWEQFVERVPNARKYLELVNEKGGNIVIDHIAFRTFNTHTGEQPEGIRAIKHILNFLGYLPVTKYKFPKKKLNATHFEHPNEKLPKIFVSQLEVSELPGWAESVINDTVHNTYYLLSDRSLELLRILEENKELPNEAADYLVDDIAQYFRRPWNIPLKEDVLKINDVSQFGAWVLIHGNAVNHFAVSINGQNIKEWPDLDLTCKALRDSGIPMKVTIEGETGSMLRQAATLASKEEVDVKAETVFEKMFWTYAYLELTERNYIDVGGERKLFSGFLAEQANHFFNLTETHEN